MISIGSLGTSPLIILTSHVMKPKGSSGPFFLAHWIRLCVLGVDKGRVRVYFVGYQERKQRESDNDLELEPYT